jgi:hypothetical protein
MPQAFDPALLLDAPLMAILGTLSPDGPRTAPVWFLWEDGALWMLGDDRSASVRRLSADPRCSVEITEFDAEAGVLRHLGLRGRAEVLPMDSVLFRRLLAKYLGPDPATWNAWFIDTVARPDDPSGRLIRLVPDSVFTNDVSYFRTGPARTPRRSRSIV